MVDNSRRNSINDDYEIPNDNVLFSQGDLARSRLADIMAEEQRYQNVQQLHHRIYFDDEDEEIYEEEGEENLEYNSDEEYNNVQYSI